MPKLKRLTLDLSADLREAIRLRASSSSPRRTSVAVVRTILMKEFAFELSLIAQGRKAPTPPR